MIDRLAPLRRPLSKPQGFQRWHRLLFSHWELPASVLRPLVDPRLTLDDFEGRCFVGLVAFEMKRVRPFNWLPRIPTATNFAEINLRTYVHLEGQEPGVFFFSLDAASALVVKAARLGWGLPYFHCDVQHEDKGTSVEWRARRRADATFFRARFDIGAARAPPSPETLEFFIAERYQFYASRGGALVRARVHHRPYELKQAHVSFLETTLLEAAGLPSASTRLPDYFSEGVDVDVYPLSRL